MDRPLQAEAARWRARPEHELVWARFDDEYVAYHRPSGKTHYLNAAAATLLTKVLAEPKSAAAAADDLAVAQDAPGDGAFFGEVADLLQHLEHLGLVERA
jgi:PqqD family protein of HPr-rel-A system